MKTNRSLVCWYNVSSHSLVDVSSHLPEAVNLLVKVELCFYNHNKIHLIVFPTQTHMLTFTDTD